MSKSFRTFNLIVCLLIALSLACTAIDDPGPREPQPAPIDPANQPSAGVADHGSGQVAGQEPAPQRNQPATTSDCLWILQDTKEALASQGGQVLGADDLPPESGSYTQSDRWVITTSATFDGGQYCADQTLWTQHKWEGLLPELQPGKSYTIALYATYSWIIPDSCNFVTAGMSTAIYFPDGLTQKVNLDKIDPKSTPETTFQDFTWQAPPGSQGDTMTIQTYGASGGQGGSIYYHYTCLKP